MKIDSEIASKTIVRAKESFRLVTLSFRLLSFIVLGPWDGQPSSAVANSGELATRFYQEKAIVCVCFHHFVGGVEWVGVGSFGQMTIFSLQMTVFIYRDEVVTDRSEIVWDR